MQFWNVAMSRKAQVVGAAAAAALAVASSPAISRELVGPFGADLPVARVARVDLTECPPPPPPVVSLATLSRYAETDKTRSSVDPDRESTYERDIKPLRDFQAEVVGWANDVVRKPRDVAKAACAYTWLKAWAEAGALSELGTRQSEFNRDQALSALGLAYLQIRGIDVGTAIERSVIVDWLVGLAEDSVEHYEHEAGAMSRRNNHRSFAALGVAAAGVIAGERRLFDWSMAWLEQATCEAGTDGSLAPEMARGKRARDYQIFATGPLVLLAEFAEANGLGAYGWCGGRLHDVVAFSLASVDDPSAVEDLAGEQQLELPPADKLGSRVAWLVPYAQRFPDEDLERRLAALGRPSSTALGGNQNVLFPSD